MKWHSRRASALAALALAFACASRPDVAPPPADVSLDELRYRVAAEPGDMRARRSLARGAIEADLPGEALRHLLVVERVGGLGDDEVTLAALYARRARERLAIGDPGALADARAAASRGHEPAEHPELWAEAKLLAALAALRRGDEDGRREAAALLSRARRYAPGDGRLSLADPERADLESLGAAAAWLYDGGARLRALEALETYVQRGGRRPEQLARYVEAYAWWHGDAERPALLLLDELAEAGAPACALARSPHELRCARALADEARTPARAAALWRRAELRHWRSDRPEHAGAWAVMALRASQRSGAPSFLAGFSRRVDAEAIAEAHGAYAAPLFAQPTLFRAAGDAASARAALTEAVSLAEGLDRHERAVLIAEAAAQRAPKAVIEAIVASGEVAPEGYTAAALAARARGSEDEEAALVARGPPAWARRYLALRGDLGALVARGEGDPAAAEAIGRWWRALSHPALASAKQQALARTSLFADAALAESGAKRASLGRPSAARIAASTPGVEADAAGALARIATAWAAEPAVADRLARRFADGATALGGRGAAVAELFFQLGDIDRTRAWSEEVAEEAPGHAPALFAAGRAMAAAGDARAAEVMFTRAAARSGRPARTQLLAAEILYAWEHPVAAARAVGRAVAHGAPGERARALMTAARIARALERGDSAKAALAQMIRETAEPFRDAARAAAAAIAKPPRAGPMWRSPRDRALWALRSGDDGALAAADRRWELDPADGELAAYVAAAAIRAGADRRAIAQRLDETLAHDPASAAARRMRLALAEPSDPRMAAVTAELLYLGLIGTCREPAAEALVAAAEGLDRLGAAELAREVRLQARVTLRDAGIAVPEDLGREYLDHGVGIGGGRPGPEHGDLDGEVGKLPLGDRLEPLIAAGRAGDRVLNGAIKRSFLSRRGRPAAERLADE